MRHNKASKIRSLSVLLALLLVLVLSACKSQGDTGASEPGNDGPNDENTTESVETPEAADMGDLSGKWYKDGDTSGEYYELTDSTCNRITADGYEYGESVYSISGGSEGFPAGDQIESTTIKFGEDMFADTGCFSPGFELFTVSELGGGTSFYVRDSVIGTAEGDAAIARYVVITSDWKSTDDSCAFRFYPNGAFEYLIRVDLDDGMYTFETADSGNWVVEDEALTISWLDGTEEEYDYTGNTFRVPSLDVTIFNGKADGGVLSRWYGDYTGETGEVSISEAFGGNTVNVSLYLNDDIGSMYSNSGMELDPDGGSAEDEYLALYLDGDTLTVEPLNPEFEGYAGTYKRHQTTEQGKETEIGKEDALNLINDALADRGVDIEALGLALFYDEPEYVLTTLDFTDDVGPSYVDAWIFLGEDSFFYAVTVNGGQVCRYDMANGALMGIDDMFDE